ncbi:PH domain-containing protein [Paucibacter sp. DJ1R-11]|uniref:PH domain-containing protein n=1 Tax=Paucibacter sp. DJ1R-11 TaxID=2893556 RepID=UPI0021E441B2|nr:PH domain-containing protein [Paucibacter sp. DJ1R-11]MCV2365551.1 PH domain-containing protein [Paucibacter sp. DJ1R-11]
MSNYITSALAKDERVLYQGRVSYWSVAVPLAVCAFFMSAGLLVLIGGLVAGSGGGPGLVWLVIGAVVGVMAYIKLKTTELAITSKRVIAKFGFISRKTVELNLSKIESIQVDQSILGRMLNYGSLVIAGGGNPQAPIPGISDPMGFRKAFAEASDKAA